jgi:hypothetical protein
VLTGAAIIVGGYATLHKWLSGLDLFPQ